ncbi:heat shock 70 kDa protein 12A-like [Mizuhopecten yessoensis]|uniref:Heat shock 70 kDa protein n=1 Tax=Mizuhopecten yessoensis TaxID=6573 RepID=A0A1C9U306_MIZYE|nr:heat shock 70 kDa protein 12A-like [Mizuhopecten yessoensis]XP_021376560.1 heat shock 70 kDa protein 12A-like [Mizuhopecten yessoensis]AOR17374.1 heat shock 70 kDa protein [Mizuhopecten yessoensis]OWF39272.1 Heat shock 70 kDa protein 12B [Mizuhopecten yessoensis]
MAAAGGGISTHLFVAAIDFGTTYSGYAFSAKDDFRKEPLKINANVWNAGARSLMSHKAPTALLLNPDKTFNSFGYEAENNFSQLAEEGEHKDYYFFHRFKMFLYNNKNLHRETTVKEEGGERTLPALEVFSHSIRYLKNHLVDSIQKMVTGIHDNDIKFVLTVPAIWDDKAKQFMRVAAKKGGIKETQLAIALEPEAASIFCQHLPVERSGAGNESFLKGAKSGTSYMVLDLGGGTADITVHRRQLDGTLRELLPATGGAFGGKSIDDAFSAFLADIIGEDSLKKLQMEAMEDYIDLFREFETKKRANFQDKPGKVSVTMPVALMDIVKKDLKGKTMEDVVKSSPHAEDVQWGKQKLQISKKRFQGLFGPTITGIIKHMEGILNEEKFQDVENILMVGGFSECELVQNAVRGKFGKKRIIVPDEAGLAVLKGAVLYGHMPKVISSRVARHTYGIQSWPAFDPLRHPAEKKVVINGVARCKDAFFKYIEIGQQVTPGHTESQVFQALKPDEATLECTVYVSDQRDPVFVDDGGCTRLGLLTVPLDPNRRGAVEVEETLVFGETELHVQAKDMANGNMYEARFDFLGEGF